MRGRYVWQTTLDGVVLVSAMRSLFSENLYRCIVIHHNVALFTLNKRGRSEMLLPMFLRRQFEGGGRQLVPHNAFCTEIWYN